MSREMQGYREMIEGLEASYPGKLMFSVKEVAAICGVSQDTVRRRVPMQPEIHRINRHELARFMCGGR